MKHLRTAVLMSFLLLVALCAAPAAAQDEPANALLDMLALVPDTETTHTGIPVVSYADYRALEAVRGITEPPLNSTDDLRSETGSLWLAATRGLGAGIQINYLPDFIEGMADAVGFRFVDIDRSLTFGSPPSMGTLLGGDFDAAAIAAAFTAREFTQTTIDGVPVWCGPDGCDDGQAVNFTTRNVANPFGGHLGRNEPLAVLPGYLADSADYTVVEDMVGAYLGRVPALADNPVYAALAQAAGASGTVAQFVTLNFADTGIVTPDLLGELPDSFRAAVAAFGTLPPYSVFALADVWDGGSQQITLLMLAYSDATQAETAAAEVAGRLKTTVSLAMGGSPLLDLLTDRGGSVGQPYVFAGKSGYAIAVVPVVAPVPSNAPQDSFPTYLPSSLVFNLFVQAIYQRDMAFIASEITLPPQ
jgi:hypothetical protein